MEDLIVKKIEGGLRGLKNKTKEPLEVWKHIKKLKGINPMLAEDFEKQYIELMKKDAK